MENSEKEIQRNMKNKDKMKAYQEKKIRKVKEYNRNKIHMTLSSLRYLPLDDDDDILNLTVSLDDE